MKLVFPNANTSEAQITRILFETKFCPSYLKGRAGSEYDDAATREDDEEAWCRGEAGADNDGDVDDNNVDDKGVDDDDDDDDVEGRGLVLSWGQMFLSPAWHPAFLSPTATFTLCFIFQIIFSICGGDCESENFAQRPIRPFSWKNFKTTIFTVALFMVQISPKYFIH